MEWVTQFLTPEVGVALVVFWLVSNVVSSMPKPDALREVGVGPIAVLFYDSFYKFAHLCVGNAAKVFPVLRAYDKPKNGNGASNASKT